MRRVVLATGNPGKLAELRALLAAVEIDVVAQSELDVPPIEETAPTFVENALAKARNAAAHCGCPAIADDSGLEVDALDGAPGVRSARYAGDGASDEENNRKLLAALAAVAPARRTASFHCAMVYLESPQDPTPLIAQGRWCGRVLEAPRGGGGFGYDPLFYVPELGRTAAELEPEVKNRSSHRARALRDLVTGLRHTVNAS